MWLEWKVFRQYQFLFDQGLKRMNEICYHISINSRLIGENSAKTKDYPALDLTLKFFNTFLR